MWLDAQFELKLIQNNMCWKTPSWLRLLIYIKTLTKFKYADSKFHQLLAQKSMHMILSSVFFNCRTVYVPLPNRSLISMHTLLWDRISEVADHDTPFDVPPEVLFSQTI